MRNSKRSKFFQAAGCFFIFIVILLVLDLMLYPCTYVRNDIHTLTTEKRSVLILGTSNARMDIDPDILLEGTGETGQNLANGGEYLCDSYYILKLDLEKNQPSTVILDVDPGYLVTEKEQGNNYLLFYHEFPVSLSKLQYFTAIMPDCDFRALLFPSYEYPLKTTIPRAPETVSTKLENNYNTDMFSTKNMRYHANGFIERYPVAEDQFPGWNPVLFQKKDVKKENISYLKKIVQLCRKKDIRLVVTSLPQPDRSLATNPQNNNEAWDYLSQICENYQVEYYNFNREYYDSFSHDVSCFVDYDGHMNGDSAEQFSSVLGHLLLGGEKNRWQN